MNGATMTASHQKPETIARGARMLRTALGASIARFLEDPGVVEVMLNPDGRIWVDRLSEGLADTGEKLSAADPANTGWQWDVSISHERLGDVAVSQGKLDEAKGQSI